MSSSSSWRASRPSRAPRRAPPLFTRLDSFSRARVCPPGQVRPQPDTAHEHKRGRNGWGGEEKEEREGKRRGGEWGTILERPRALRMFSIGRILPPEENQKCQPSSQESPTPLSRAHPRRAHASQRAAPAGRAGAASSLDCAYLRWQPARAPRAARRPARLHQPQFQGAHPSGNATEGGGREGKRGGGRRNQLLC